MSVERPSPIDAELAERRPRLRKGLAAVAAVAVAAGIVWLLFGAAGEYGAQYTAVALLGGSVGVGELVSRYRDRPWKALRAWPAIGYIVLNAAAAAGALLLVISFDWTFGATGKDEIVATRLLVAGFGSMALFRTSLFTVRAGDQDVGIGPSSLLSIVLAACDRGVDRERAKDRALQVGDIMLDVSFEKAKGPLPTVALALMQNLDAPDQAALGVQVEKLSNETQMSDRAKSLLLGLAISNAVGPHVLQHAKEALGEEILRTAPDSNEEESGMSASLGQWLRGRRVGRDAPPRSDAPSADKTDAADSQVDISDARDVDREPAGLDRNNAPDTSLDAPGIPGTDAQAREPDPGLPQTPQTPG